MKYIITGGEGFIGSRIVKSLNGYSYDIKSGLDILNQTKLIESTENSDGIFHCAAKISVPESILMPDVYHEVNVIGTRNVVGVAGKLGVKIVFSSSCAVYGESGESIIENTILNPKSPYAENKAEAEKILLESGKPHVALRYFNVYGPGQSKQYAGVITSFIQKALNNDNLIIYGDGEQTRDFVYVDDVVRANQLAMNYSSNIFEVFNIASGVNTSVNELAKTIIELTNSSSRIEYRPERAGDIKFSKANISKAKEALCWQPQYKLRDGLIKTIEYYRKNK